MKKGEHTFAFDMAGSAKQYDPATFLIAIFYLSRGQLLFRARLLPAA